MITLITLKYKNLTLMFKVSSKSLLANVLDMDDNFCNSTIVTSSVTGLHVNNNHCGNLIGNGCIYPRYLQPLFLADVGMI